MNWKALVAAAEKRQRMERMQREFADLADRAALCDPRSELSREFDELVLAVTDPDFFELLTLARSPLPSLDLQEEVNLLAAAAGLPTHMRACAACSHPAGVHRNTGKGKNLGRCGTKGCACLGYQRDPTPDGWPDDWPKAGHDDSTVAPPARGLPHESPVQTTRRVARSRGHVTASGRHAGVIVTTLPRPKQHYSVSTGEKGWEAYRAIRAICPRPETMRELVASGAVSARKRPHKPYTNYLGPPGRALTVWTGLDGHLPFICDAATGRERTDLELGPRLSLVAAGTLTAPAAELATRETDAIGLLRVPLAALTAAVTALGRVAGRPQPAPVFNVNVPPQPAPIVNVRVEAPKAAPTPVVHAHVHVPNQKPRSIKVESDGMGGKVYRSIADGDE